MCAGLGWETELGVLGCEVGEGEEVMMAGMGWDGMGWEMLG